MHVIEYKGICECNSLNKVNNLVSVSFSSGKTKPTFLPEQEVPDLFQHTLKNHTKPDFVGFTVFIKIPHC